MRGGLEERIDGTGAFVGGGLEQWNGMVVGLWGFKVVAVGTSFS